MKLKAILAVAAPTAFQKQISVRISLSILINAEDIHRKYIVSSKFILFRGCRPEHYDAMCEKQLVVLTKLCYEAEG